METSVVKTEKSVATFQPPTDETLISFLDSLGMTKKLTQGEKQQYLEICKAYQLNPFKREIHVSKYGDAFSVITGYEVYIKRAERSGKLQGWKVETSGQVRDNSLKAKITIYRKDWEYPFEHEVYYAEYVQKKKDGTVNKFWREKPVTMTKKVAIAQGFRLCFADELGGMPYTQDETGWEPVTIPQMDQPKDGEDYEEPDGKAPDKNTTKSASKAPAGNADKSSSGTDDKPITAAQRKKLFASLNEAGGTEDDLRSLIAEYGYQSTKDIKRKDFDLILQKLIPVNIDDF